MNAEKPLYLPVHLNHSSEMESYYAIIDRARNLLIEQAVLTVREWKQANPLFPPFKAWIDEDASDMGLQGPYEKKLLKEDRDCFAQLTKKILGTCSHDRDIFSTIYHFIQHLNEYHWSNEIIDVAISECITQSHDAERAQSFLSHLNKNILQDTTPALPKKTRSARL